MIDYIESLKVNKQAFLEQLIKDLPEKINLQAFINAISTDFVRPYRIRVAIHRFKLRPGNKESGGPAIE